MYFFRIERERERESTLSCLHVPLRSFGPSISAPAMTTASHRFFSFCAPNTAGRSADAARNQHKMMGRPRAVFKSFTRAVSEPASQPASSQLGLTCSCLPIVLSWLYGEYVDSLVPNVQ